MTHCDVCDYDYNEKEKADLKEHDRLHRLFTDRSAELGYTPRGPNSRDVLYRKAINLIQAYDFGSRTRGSMLLIRRHFDRSLHLAIVQGYYREHPTFGEYLSMCFDSFRQVPIEIKAHFLEEYGSRRGEIAPGYTHWYPRNSEERTKQHEEYRLYDSKVRAEYVRPLSLLVSRSTINDGHLFTLFDVS